LENKYNLICFITILVVMLLMDKKLKRIIGYKPNSSVQNKNKDTSPTHELKTEVPITNLAPTQEINVLDVITVELKKTEKVIKWINTHPEFKWGVMCNKIGIDKGNFQRTLKSANPKIKIEFIPKIIDFLKKYGYAE